MDDGTKSLTVPLFAVPTAEKVSTVGVSNGILEELSHEFNGETSASFLSLALFHRYNKSGAGEDGPKLRVLEGLLV